jgi:hypothetical protein
MVYGQEEAAVKENQSSNMQNQHKMAVRMISVCKHHLRRLVSMREAVRAKHKALKRQGVAIGPDSMQQLIERIDSVNSALFELVRLYDLATIKPNLHERAQLLGVSHIALVNHRAGIVAATGKRFDETLMTDIIIHGEIAGERGCATIWNCTGRDYPLFDACCLNLIQKVELPEGWLESFLDEMAEQAKQKRREYLRVVV